MSNSIKIATATFTKVLTALTLPVRTALVAESILGVSSVASSRNLANPAVPLLEMGAPTYSASGVVVRPTATGFGFDTQITPNGDCTMIIIKKPGSSGAIAAGSSVGGNLFGFGAFGGGDWFYNGSSSFGGGASCTPVAGAWMFQAGVANFGGLARLVRYESGVQVASNSSGVMSVLPGRCYIGSAGITTGQAYDASVAYFAVYNRKLTDAEIDAAYQSLKVFFALKGIAI